MQRLNKLSNFKGIQGFTLIELLVVLGVIGILATGVVFVVNPIGQFEKARDAKRRTDLKTVATALELYNNDYGQYPSTAGQWWSACNAWSGNHGTSGANGWVPNLAPEYIQQLPLDPKRKTETGSITNSKAGGGGASVFCYVYRSNGLDYKLAAHCGAENQAVPSSDAMYKGTGAWGCGNWHFAIWTPGAESW